MNAIDTKKQSAERQRFFLSKFERLQEDAILIHYSRVMGLVQGLSILMKIRDEVRSPVVEESIKYLTDKIREQHLTDFGIELEWPDTTRTTT